MSDYVLNSGISNYADTHRQAGDGELVPESGQVPKHYHGISSAYPSPSGGEDIIATKPSREPLVSDDSVFDYEGLLNNLSGPKREVVEDINYLNDYIHYYPRAVEVKTLYGRTVEQVPVRVQSLNFVRTDYSPDPRYNYKPEEE